MQMPKARPKTEAATQLGKRIRRARDENGLTQKALADAVGVSTETISRLETGSWSNPTLQVLEALSHALDTPIASLIGEADTPPQPELSKDKRRMLALLDGLSDYDVGRVHKALSLLLAVRSAPAQK